MLGNYIFITTYLVKAFFFYVFGSKNSLNPVYLSSVYLFSKSSFRLPESSKTDRLIILKIFFYSIKNSFTKKIEFKKYQSNKPIAVLDGDFNSEQNRMQYLNFFNVHPNFFLSKENLYGSMNLIGACIHSLFIFIIFIFLLPFSLSSNRATYALLLREMPELVNLIGFLKANGITHLYQFCIYEKDANFNAFILSKKHIKVSKITSEVPLVFANKIIIADEINICFAYQQEELNAFKNGMHYSKVNQWLPEMQITYLDHYNNKDFKVARNVIGFYSSAFWLRKQSNHSIADVGSYDVEEDLLLCLKEYLYDNPDLKLIVFSHPYEKRTPELFEKTLKYYHAIFGGLLLNRIEVTGKESNSVTTFHKVNVGISVFSTISFERLSLGFKSILAPFDKKEFPLSSSPFRNICAYNKSELFTLLDYNFLLERDVFFSKNNIEAYVNPKVQVSYELV